MFCGLPRQVPQDFVLDDVYKTCYFTHRFVQIGGGVAMGDLVSRMKLSEVRSKLTQLDKLLKPGEALQINKRGKAYARIELIGEMDRYDRVLNSINSLPEPKEKLRAVAQNYKSILYGSNNANSKRL